MHSLPDGYDTVLDAEAGNISAGEKQLLTIARAFLSDPALLILDEATSSVDTRTELLVQRAMSALRQDRTSFVIAHRLSTIRDADLILVMQDGRIVEQGSHDDLLAAGGAFAELYAAQFRSAVAEPASSRPSPARRASTSRQLWRRPWSARRRWAAQQEAISRKVVRQRTTPKPPFHGDLLAGGEGDLEEAEGLELAGPLEGAGVDDREATGLDDVRDDGLRVGVVTGDEDGRGERGRPPWRRGCHRRWC